MLRYTITMPPKPAIADLATREVTLVLGPDTDKKSLGPDETSFQFDTDRDVPVSITLVDIDTSGNRSAPSVPLAFVATDNIPPPAPGGMSVANVEQIDSSPASKAKKK